MLMLCASALGAMQPHQVVVPYGSPFVLAQEQGYHPILLKDGRWPAAHVGQQDRA